MHGRDTIPDATETVDTATTNPIQKKVSRINDLYGGDEEEGNEEEVDGEDENADVPGTLTRAERLAGMKQKTGTDDDLRVSTIRLSQVGEGTFKVSTKSVRDKLIALEEANSKDRYAFGQSHSYSLYTTTISP